MLRQFIILGLVLLIAGGIGLVRTLPYHADWAALGLTPKATLLADRPKAVVPVQLWPVQVPESPQDLNDQLVQLHGLSQATLKTQKQARLQADLDRLAGGYNPDPALATALYGDNWQQQVARYKSGKERSDFILTGSFVLGLVGLIIFTCCVLVGMARLVIKIARFVAGLIMKAIKKPRPIVQGAASPSYATEEDAVHVQESGRPRLGRPRRGRAKITVGVGDALASDESVSYQRTYPTDEVDPMVHADLTLGAEPVEPTEDLRPSLAVQTEAIERQLRQFKEMVQTIPRPDSDPSAPFNKTLLQLNEQISAIREYAAEQQQRVEKLESGYDWNIIRTFCLRVIRCIDNLEDRMARLDEQGQAIEALDQVCEELLFALESSGVEPFEPQVGSVYRGQERWAEAIKEREPCDEPQLKGCIFAVVRPGYQYVVDEQNLKVVRAARVKLYG